MSIIAGTPDQVVEKLRVVLEETRPSILALWGNDGKVSHEDSMTCILLMGQEVMPRLREIGRNLGLTDPFEANAPTSFQFPEPAYAPAEALAPKAEAVAD